MAEFSADKTTGFTEADLKKKGQAQKFQVVTIRLSDGSAHSLIGLAFTKQNDERKVTGVSITDPLDLPPDLADLFPILQDTGDGVSVGMSEEVRSNGDGE
jgi:hypothetical protein